jgi:DNA primase catalytic core
MEIKDIKQQLSILEVLAHYGLKPDRNNRLHCPFHPDKTPSLQIYPATNTYCCFSSNCTAGTGDAIQFIQLKENCSKHEALVKATALLGGNIPTAQPQEENAKLFVDTELMAKEAVLTKLFKYFTKALPLTKKAVEYLASRSINYQKHEVGYNSGDWHYKLNEVHFLKSCVQYGLLKPLPAKGYSVWAKDCIIFPLKNAEGKIVSFYGRSIIIPPSGKTEGASRHFYLQNRSGLYPGYPSLQTKQLILTESIIDAASLLQQKEIASQYCVLSLYGTNGLTDEHLQAITTLPQLEEIIFMLDGDEAGDTATAKHTVTLKQLLPEIKISKTILPDGEDVNSVLQNHDDAAVLQNMIDNRTDFSFSIEKEKQQSSQNLTVPALPPLVNLDTTNTELLVYHHSHLRIEVLGGIKLTGLDRMKVTLKVQHTQKQLLPIRDTLDLYNRTQTEHLIQTVSEHFDCNIKQTETIISELTTE